MKSAIALLLLQACLSSLAMAQNLTPVVDLSNPMPAKSATDATVVASTAAVSAGGNQYYQMQVLQEEVQMLRGLVEELNYELQQIKQRQMDDYLDLDRRLSAVASGRPAAKQNQSGTKSYGGVDTVPSKGDGVLTGAVSAEVVDAAVIKANYDNASNLLLKQRDMDGAVMAFKRHIVDFPTSPYAPNAYYWLGEIYLLQGQDELSRQAFTSVLEQYADHGKAMDSRFKLGKIYHQLGELERARELLELAAQSNGSVAIKSRDYLDKNF